MNLCNATYYPNDCNQEQIENAETQLGFTFPDVYKNFLINFGALSFSNHNIFGICENNKLNTVHITLDERKHTSSFPADSLVLDYTGKLHNMILLNSEEKVLAFTYGKKPVEVCNSLQEYLELCDSESEWKDKIRKSFMHHKTY
jgi:hypothetical protein